MRTLPLFNLSNELIDDNRNEQVHDEERSQEDIDDENERNGHLVVLFHDHVDTLCVNCIEHDIRPHF